VQHRAALAFFSARTRVCRKVDYQLSAARGWIGGLLYGPYQEGFMNVTSRRVTLKALISDPRRVVAPVL
jgi:hypothetical protein